MSDIFQKPEIPDPLLMTCPDCGKLPGFQCAPPPATWNCGARIWAAQLLVTLKYLKQPEPEYATQAMKDSYVEGWNDAIDAIIDRVKQ